MLVSPPPTPVTTPVSEPTFAIPVEPELHNPPVVAMLRVVAPPTQTWLMPVIGGGAGFTVILLVAKHPAPSEYVITTEPAEIPEAKPLDEPTDATTGLLLVHTPPDVASVSVTEVPTHSMAAGPAIGNGPSVTVSVRVTKQPVGSVYVIVAEPVITPVNNPVAEPMMAIEVELLVHVPPAVLSVSVVVAPAQSAPAPVMTAGSGLTVSTAVIEQPLPNE